MSPLLFAMLLLSATLVLAAVHCQAMHLVYLEGKSLWGVIWPASWHDLIWPNCPLCWVARASIAATAAVALYQLVLPRITAA